MADLTFPVYRKVVGLVGGRPVQVPLRNYAHDLEALAAAVTDRTKLVFLCNPNNPTGTALPGPAQEAFIRALPEHVAVILDEVYLDFTDPAQLPDTLGLIRAGRPVISIRSFSKLYGLAGLRIGYALADPELIVALTKVKEPFAVNRLAQAGALAALGDETYRERTIRLTLQGRDFLAAAFRAQGLACPDSQTNFVMVDLGREAGPVCEGLLRRGLFVRNLAAWGASTCLRITVGTEEQNRRLVQAVAEILG
jgi:histidinol-phosphate aminotransferase